jgi:general secretion pathway protein N
MTSQSQISHRTEPPWTWAATGAVLGLVIAMVVFAPAHWLTTLVQQLSGERLLLAQPQGTVWSGSAQLVLTGGAGSSEAVALPGRVRWQLQASWPAWQLQINATCCTPQALHVQVTPRWGALHLSMQDSISQWPLDLLAGLGTPWNTVQAKGQMHLSTQGLSISLAQGRLVMAGRAQLEALDMSSRLSSLRPMGSYKLTLQNSDKVNEAIGLELSTLHGSLELMGHGHWADSRWHFEGSANAAPERLDALSNLLNIIGRRDGTRSIITIG